jgi:cell wall-associated NlpC family hydrolase
LAVNWWGAYVGRQFRGGSECWSLVRDVYRDRLGVDLPAYGDVSAAYTAAVEALRFGHLPRTQIAAARRAVMDAFDAGQAGESWTPVVNPQEFDVVLMGGPHADRRRVMHVGVAVDALRVLHIEQATGSVVVPLSHPSVAGRIIGYRRHVACSDRLS